jgi:hypothetical protein
MGRKIIEVVSLLGMAFFDQSGWADTMSVETTSTTTTKKPVLERLSEIGTLNYFGVYRGASLSNLGNTMQPAVSGSPSNSPQSIESTLTAGYKVNPDLVVGAMGHFYYYPVGNPVGTGQDLQMLDPILTVNQSNIVNAHGFKLAGRYSAHLPLTKVDTLQTNNLATALTTTWISSYEVPNTTLTVGLFGYLRGYVPTENAGPSVLTYKVYLAPNANYQLSKTVALTLWVDLLQITRNRGTGFISGMTNDVVDIEPGINWDLTKNVSLNPVINIYPTHPTLASTSLQAFIIARAF